MAYGFGIIGCGMIAKFHARAIADIRGAKLVGCYDTFAESADRLAAQTGCRAYHRLSDLLADPAVDVVTIGTPSGAHMEPAVAAARAGKHVIVEKPLEITLGARTRSSPPAARRTSSCRRFFPRGSTIRARKSAARSTRAASDD